MTDSYNQRNINLSLDVLDDAVPVVDGATELNFTGAGVVVTPGANPGEADIAIPGGPGADIRTARIIVGNALAGDTVANVDFLDSGNGAGVAAALAAAAAALTPTDLYIKSGVYDFTLAGAPALPLTIPTGLLFRGAGSSVEAGNGTIFSIGSTQRALFVVSNHAEIGQFSVLAALAAVGAAGTAILDMGTNVTATDITISIPGNLNSPDESLTAAMRAGTFSQLTRIIVQASSYSTVARILSGIEIDNNEVTCDQCVVSGLDYGFRTLDDNRCIFSACRSLFQSERGFWLVGNQNQIAGCFVRNFGVRGIVLENGFGSAITDTTVQSSGGLTGIEILADHDNARIINNTIRLGAVGIEVGANSGTLIGPNKFDSVLNEIVIAGGATEVSREVPTVISDTILIANHLAEVGEILRYDASAGTFTLSAPSSAARGDEFGIKEMVGNATVITVSGNGFSIQHPVTGVYAATAAVGVANIGTKWIFDGTVWFVVSVT